VIEVEQLPADRLGEWLELRNRIGADDPLVMDVAIRHINAKLGYRIAREIVRFRGPPL
jgi:hypothetical protein